mgnify:CR=1 FL=1
MSRKSVTMVSNNYWTLYKFRYDIIRMLIDEGYIVHLIAKNDTYQKYFRYKNIHIHFLPLEERGKNIFKELSTFISIHKLHRKIKPDLVFNFTLKPNIYSNLSAAILNIKTISMITGLGHIFIKGNILYKAIVILLLRLSLKKTQEIWFTNKHDEEYFRKIKIISLQKTSIVPGAGVKIKDRGSLRKKNNGHYIFLMVSRLLKEKGTSEFLEAANFFKKDLSKKFILVGAHTSDKNHILKELLDNMNKNDVITYIPYTDNIESLFEKADCIIHPSYREGMSTVLLEAASLKIPIITSNVPGCIDIILNENYGFLCNKSDSESLIGQIIMFTQVNNEDPKKIDAMVERTYKHISKNFNRSDIVNKYREIVRLY